MVHAAWKVWVRAASRIPGSAPVPGSNRVGLGKDATLVIASCIHSSSYVGMQAGSKKLAWLFVFATVAIRFKVTLEELLLGSLKGAMWVLEG